MSDYRDKLESLAFRAKKPDAKQTVDVTDTTVNTVTEHFDDRVDVTVRPNPIKAGTKIKEP